MPKCGSTFPQIQFILRKDNTLPCLHLSLENHRYTSMKPQNVYELGQGSKLEQ